MIENIKQFLLLYLLIVYSSLYGYKIKLPNGYNFKKNTDVFFTKSKKYLVATACKDSLDYLFEIDGRSLTLVKEFIGMKILDEKYGIQPLNNGLIIIADNSDKLKNYGNEIFFYKNHVFSKLKLPDSSFYINMELEWVDSSEFLTILRNNNGLNEVSILKIDSSSIKCSLPNYAQFNNYKIRRLNSLEFIIAGVNSNFILIFNIFQRSYIKLILPFYEDIKSNYILENISIFSNGSKIVLLTVDSSKKLKFITYEKNKETEIKTNNQCFEINYLYMDNSIYVLFRSGKERTLKLASFDFISNKFKILSEYKLKREFYELKSFESKIFLKSRSNRFLYFEEIDL